MLKRLFDILVAIALLPFALCICAIVAVVYLLLERSNPLFRQTRLGRHEKPFTLYKLRTLRPETRNAASHEINADSVTTVGRLLRKTKLDELPQLLNVLVGSMSLVGPRPGLPEQLELTVQRRKHGLYAIRPGITGVSQIKGLDMSNPEQLAISDAEYLQTQSLAGDIRILVQTVLGAGSGDAMNKPG